MKTKVINIFDIKSGVFLKPHPQGNGYYLLAKHLNNSGSIIFPAIKNLEYDRALKNHRLSEGDVLLVAKGDYHPAVTFGGSELPVVASTTFLILRVRPTFLSKITPEYLTWFLNQPKTQQRLKYLAKGTSISSISISILADLNLDVPDIVTQKRILKIQEMRNRETELKSAIDKLKEEVLQWQLLQATKRN